MVCTAVIAGYIRAWNIRYVFRVRRGNIIVEVLIRTGSILFCVARIRGRINLCIPTVGRTVYAAFCTQFNVKSPSCIIFFPSDNHHDIRIARYSGDIVKTKIEGLKVLYVYCSQNGVTDFELKNNFLCRHNSPGCGNHMALCNRFLLRHCTEYMLRALHEFYLFF